MPINLKHLAGAIESTGARWKASTKDIKEHALGYLPGLDEHSLQTREMLAVANHKNFMAMAGAPTAYPPEFDWRQALASGGRPAGDYVTPIRDQGQCGSCVSFGSVAALESAELIKNNTPANDLDLSEAFLFFCHKGVAGGNCDVGWNVNTAMTSLQGTGTVDEECFPYTDHQQACNSCSDWVNRLKKIKAWHTITATSGMKNWIANYGPLVTCFTVYQDFDAYSTGVYHHVSGAARGGHCVCCIGYDDKVQAWICKNSWGNGWGEKGFFYIAYSQCGIDAMMWALQLT